MPPGVKCALEHGCKAHLSQLLTFSNAVIGAGTLAWIGVPVWESVENNSLTMWFRGDNDINLKELHIKSANLERGEGKEEGTGSERL